jgi:hypothetical protein
LEAEASSWFDSSLERWWQPAPNDAPPARNLVTSLWLRLWIANLGWSSLKSLMTAAGSDELLALLLAIELVFDEVNSVCGYDVLFLGLLSFASFSNLSHERRVLINVLVEGHRDVRND